MSPGGQAGTPTLAQRAEPQLTGRGQARPSPSPTWGSGEQRPPALPPTLATPAAPSLQDPGPGTWDPRSVPSPGRAALRSVMLLTSPLGWPTRSQHTSLLPRARPSAHCSRQNLLERGFQQAPWAFGHFAGPSGHLQTEPPQPTSAIQAPGPASGFDLGLSSAWSHTCVSTHRLLSCVHSPPSPRSLQIAITLCPQQWPVVSTLAR